MVESILEDMLRNANRRGIQDSQQMNQALRQKGQE
jgi:hypothetical protein